MKAKQALVVWIDLPDKEQDSNPFLADETARAISRLRGVRSVETIKAIDASDVVDQLILRQIHACVDQVKQELWDRSIEGVHPAIYAVSRDFVKACEGAHFDPATALQEYTDTLRRASGPFDDAIANALTR